MLKNKLSILRNRSSRARRRSTLPSSNPATHQLSPLLELLFQQIESNDWKSFDREFLSNCDGRSNFQLLADLVEEKSTLFHGMTLLHAVVRFNPPAQVVQEVIELCPHAPRSQDCMGRTPLHVMAGTGASSEVIKVLATAFPDACMIQDVDGRTPLHLLCNSSCKLFEDDNKSKSKPSRESVIELLIASPESVMLEDNEEMSAIEYALYSLCDMKIIKILQSSAQRIHMRRQKAIEIDKVIALSAMMNDDEEEQVKAVAGMSTSRNRPARHSSSASAA